MSEDDVIECQEKVAELINDELMLYTGDSDGDIELSWFITTALMDEYVVLPGLESHTSAITIYFKAQSLDDLFKYCQEQKRNVFEFVEEKIMESIY